MGQRKRPYKAVGIYIFAGGFSIGINQAGFQLRAHLEGGSYGVPTFKRNFPHVPVWYPHVTWPLSMLAKEGVDLIHANPPCAAWSMAGKTLHAGKTSWLKDERVSCVKHLFHAAGRVQPTVFVWESVTQAWTRARELIVQLTRQAREWGYKTWVLFTSAYLHGVPQPRRRFMMFCSKVELDLPLPDPALCQNIKDALGLERDEDGVWTQRCPVWGEPESQPRYTRLMRCTPGGGDAEDTWRSLFENEDGEVSGDVWGNNKRPAFMVKRVDMYGPGTTFTSQVKDYHPVFNRFLSNSEVGRLSGWPDDYKWVEQHDGPIRAQMAQAVLPPVGYYTGKVVKRALDENKPVQDLELEVVNHIKQAGF